MVDNADCVKIIKDFWQQKKLKRNILTEEIKNLALERGNAGVLNILDVKFQTQMELKIPQLNFDINPIPKSEEYEYIDIMKKIKKILSLIPLFSPSPS